jgi:hypothetical protein
MLIHSLNFISPYFMSLQLVRGSHFAHRCSAVLSLRIRPMTRPSVCDFFKCKKDLHGIDWCFGRCLFRDSDWSLAI